MTPPAKRDPRLRRRAVLYATLALLAPLPAFALDGGSGPRLETAASLSGCGVQETTMVCTLAVSFNRLPGAAFYTAKITRPDGGVQDYGTVAEEGEGGRAVIDLSVTYAGSGAYTVSVAAWSRGESGEPELIERSKSSTGGAPAEEKSEKEDEEPAKEPASESACPAESDPKPLPHVPPPGETVTTAASEAEPTETEPCGEPEEKPQPVDEEPIQTTTEPETTTQPAPSEPDEPSPMPGEGFEPPRP